MGAGEVWWCWGGGTREEPTGVRPTGAHRVAQAHTGLPAASRAQTDFAAPRPFCLPLDPEWAGRVRWAWLGPQATLMPSFCPDAFWPVSGMTLGPLSSGSRGLLPPELTGHPPGGLLVPGALDPEVCVSWRTPPCCLPGRGQFVLQVPAPELSSRRALEPFLPRAGRGSHTFPCPLLLARLECRLQVCLHWAPLSNPPHGVAQRGHRTCAWRKLSEGGVREATPRPVPEQVSKEQGRQMAGCAPGRPQAWSPPRGGCWSQEVGFSSG